MKTMCVKKKLRFISTKSRKKINSKPNQLKAQRKRKTEAAKEPTEVTNSINIQPETSHTNINSSINDFVSENDDDCGMSYTLL